jgi:hypothetical protein
MTKNQVHLQWHCNVGQRRRRLLSSTEGSLSQFEPRCVVSTAQFLRATRLPFVTAREPTRSARQSRLLAPTTLRFLVPTAALLTRRYKSVAVGFQTRRFGNSRGSEMGNDASNVAAALIRSRDFNRDAALSGRLGYRVDDMPD